MRILIVGFLLFFFFPSLEAASFTPKERQLVEIIALLEVTNENSDEVNEIDGLGDEICKALGVACYNSTVAEAICKAGSGMGCYDVSIGEAICKAGSGFGCYGVTVGEGICKAGNGMGCFNSTVGEGICKGGGAVGCFNMSTGEAICKVRGGYSCYGKSVKQALEIKIVDRDWEWDEFYDQGYRSVWRCRGVQTGQFADDEKCNFKLKLDTTWPSKQANP